MGGKKKGGGGKKKGAAAAPEEDDSIDKFFKYYKRRCTEYEVPKCGTIMEKYDLFLDEQEIPARFHVWSELGWAGTRAVMDGLRDAK